MTVEGRDHQVDCRACGKSHSRDGGGRSPTLAVGLRELGTALWQERGLEQARGIPLGGVKVSGSSQQHPGQGRGVQGCRPSPDPPVIT